MFALRHKCFVATALFVGRARIRKPLAVEMMANAHISTCVVEAFLVLSISIYIIQNFNCQVKNYFWNA